MVYIDEFYSRYSRFSIPYNSMNNELETNSPIEEPTETSPLLDHTQETLLTDNGLKSITDESPYEEVAANVSNKDDMMLPCITFRSCFLGLLFTSILAFVNQFFTFRTIPIFLSMIVVQLVSYPIGKAMASILPCRDFVLFNERWRFSLNPGPFSIKEHCVISIMANTASVSIENLHVTSFLKLICRVLLWPSKLLSFNVSSINIQLTIS